MESNLSSPPYQGGEVPLKRDGEGLISSNFPSGNVWVGSYFLNVPEHGEELLHFVR